MATGTALLHCYLGTIGADITKSFDIPPKFGYNHLVVLLRIGLQRSRYARAILHGLGSDPRASLTSVLE